MATKRIGEILKDKGYITEEQLQEALETQTMAVPYKLLGQILIEMGFITRDQAQLFNYCHKCPTLDLVARINSTSDLESLLSAIMESAREIMEAEASSLMLKEEESEELVIAVPTGPTSAEISGIRIPSGQGFCGWTVEHAKPLVVNDAPEDPRFYQRIDSSTGFETRNLICVPLRTPTGKIIGALEAVNRRDGGNFSEADIPLFSVFADQAAIALERARLEKEFLEKQLLEQELDLAYQIQKGFWPQRVPSYPGIQIAAMNLPARHVGGDYYDFIQITPDRFAIVVGDVAGKGTGAALLMATLRSMLRAQVENHHSVEETIQRVNNALVKDTPANKFATLFFCLLDVEKRDLTYVNAGHNPPFLYDSTSGEMQCLDQAGGPIIGFMENLGFEAAHVRLHPGHVLVLFTDGVTEAQNPEDELLGEERLQQLISDNAEEDAETIRQRIYDTILEFTRGSPQFDDITMIVVKILGRRKTDPS